MSQHATPPGPKKSALRPQNPASPNRASPLVRHPPPPPRLPAALEDLRSAVRALPADPITAPGRGLGVYSTAYQAVNGVLLEMAEARVGMLLGGGGWEGVVRHLVQAVDLEPPMGYTEPPRVPQPPRQCLAWALLQAGNLDQAALEYQRDLAEFPHNPWSLVGLRQTLGEQQRRAVAGEAGEGGTGVAAAIAGVDAELEAFKGRLSHIPSSCPMF